jgi:leucyl aminopeptidase (aminopeptidase T)
MRYPDVSKYPVTVEISKGRARDARSDNSTLARQLMVYLRSNVEGDRVGELGIGTNLALDELRGIALQDEQVPGAHIAFGGAGILGSTGATWSAQTHVPMIGRCCDIDIDGRSVMRAGSFEHDLFG